MMNIDHLMSYIKHGMILSFNNGIKNHPLLLRTSLEKISGLPIKKIGINYVSIQQHYFWWEV